jgi:hypothetical protein
MLRALFVRRTFSDWRNLLWARDIHFSFSSATPPGAKTSRSDPPHYTLARKM